jgi:deoxycytidylate deaminase
MKRLLEMAWKFARNHEFNPDMGFRHCAIVAQGSKVLGVGYNRHGWSSKQNGRYSARKMNENCCTVHAEVDALLKVSNRDDIRGSTVYVVRINKKNELAMSKPCEMCSQILKEHGVKRAFFSISEDENAYGVVDFR